jgi:protein-tyrosine-phosphatase
MAEAIFRDMVGSNAIWKVESAGTYAVPNQPATGLAQAVLAEVGITLREHRSQPISHELLSEFPLVLVMEPEHRELILERFPEFEDRVFLLAEMMGDEHPIEDPFGGDPNTYRHLRDEIKQILKASANNITELAQGVL